MQVGWDDPGRTAIRVTFEEHWDWDQLTQANKFIEGLLRTVPHRAAIVLDMQACHGLPEGYLWKFKCFYERGLPNAGPLILVSNNTLITALAGALDRLPDFKRPQRPIFSAGTLEAARALLKPTH